MAHYMKHTKTAIGHLSKHYERAINENGEFINYSNENIDIKKSHLNYNLAPEHNQVDFIHERLKNVYCLNRKDVNVMCSWVVTLPKDIVPEGEKRFFQETYNFLENRYGKENVVSSYVHKDEITPHMHFAFIPVVYDTKKQRYKVSAKECVNKFELKSFHADLQKYLDSKSIKCNVLNGATKEGNLSIQELKRGTATEKLNNTLNKLNELKGDMELLENEKKALEKQIGVLKSTSNNIKVIKDKKSFFGKHEITISKETYDDCIQTKKQLDFYKNELQYTKEKLNNALYSTNANNVKHLNAMVNDLQKQVRELKAKNKQLNKTIEHIGNVLDKNPDLNEKLIEAEKKLIHSQSRNNNLTR